jgi:putative SOS response-associated peptidase YedK
MHNVYSVTINQAAIINPFRVINHYGGNLARCRVFPDYPAPVVRTTDAGSEMVLMRLGMPPPPRTGGPPVTNIRNSQGVTYEAMTCVTPAEPPESPLALARMFVMR